MQHCSSDPSYIGTLTSTQRCHSCRRSGVLPKDTSDTTGLNRRPSGCRTTLLSTEPAVVTEVVNVFRLLVALNGAWRLADISSTPCSHDNTQCRVMSGGGWAAANFLNSFYDHFNGLCFSGEGEVLYLLRKSAGSSNEIFRTQDS